MLRQYERVSTTNESVFLPLRTSWSHFLLDILNDKCITIILCQHDLLFYAIDE